MTKDTGRYTSLCKGDGQETAMDDYERIWLDVKMGH